MQLVFFLEIFNHLYIIKINFLAIFIKKFLSKLFNLNKILLEFDFFIFIYLYLKKFYFFY